MGDSFYAREQVLSFDIDGNTFVLRLDLGAPFPPPAEFSFVQEARKLRLRVTSTAVETGAFTIRGEVAR
jgi:hypothetical protein